MRSATLDSERTMRIRGILLPSDFDEFGTVTELILATADEGELLVTSADPDGDLIRFLRKEVVVEGELKQQATKKLLEIQTIEVGGTTAPRMGFESD